MNFFRNNGYKQLNNEENEDECKKLINYPYSNMNIVEYGYLKKGFLPYIYLYQNVFFKGKGRVVCKCEDVKELNFELICEDKLYFICTKENYITKFYIGPNEKLLHSSEKEPYKLIIYYDKTLTCENDIWMYSDK